MKKKRYLPFGYQMNEGNIIPDILESSAVQSIFENYRNGASLQTLAKQMQQSGLKYRENAVWNKAMIARILDCEKYISEEFPAILPSDLFLQVQRLRKDRAQIYGGSLNPALRGIRNLICCQTCGQKLVRINHRNNVYIIWKCPSCNTETRYLPDRELMSSVLSAINRAIEDPQKVMNFKKNANCLSVQAVRLENEIYRELGNPKSNSKRLFYYNNQHQEKRFGGSKKGIRFSKKFFETHRKPHGYWVPVISVTKDIWGGHFRCPPRFCQYSCGFAGFLEPKIQSDFP